LDKLTVSGWFEAPYDDLEERVICAKSGHIAQKNCPNKKKELVPARVSKSLPCPYHERIYLEGQSGKQANLSCFSEEQLRDTSWFVLSPVRAYYYAQHDASYQSPPEWHESCTNEDGSASIQLIYPKSGQTLYLPIDNDGKRNQLVLKAAYTETSGELFWHLDNIYLGKTRERHEMSLDLKPGEYQLHLIDESGKSIRSSFTILEQI
jgi:penicillin-binding protein 1C